MAVSKTPPKPQLAKDFWPKLRRTSIIVIAILQLVSIGTVALIMYTLGLFNSDPLTFSVIIASQAIISTAVLMVVHNSALRPLELLLDALVHVSGEPTIKTPPNPNSKYSEQSGLKPLLQTIYELSSGSGGASAVTGPEGSLAPREIIETALDSTICGFVTINSAREITYANRAAPIQINTDRVKSLKLLFHQNDELETWWQECEKNAVRAEKTWQRIPDRLPNEENRRFFDVIASYNKGAESEMVVVLIDRTHLYNSSEEELDFIAFAAHELRGPITVIRGYLDVLQDELGDLLQDDHVELFKRLSVSANRLSGYINNILNTSRYDRRHLRMRLTETTMARVYSTVQQDMALRASSQNRVLSVNIPEDLPTIPADTASLGEVISNIIDNAIKYSNEGGAITVTGGVKGDMVELAVEDRGIGMPSNVMSNLFQKFYRSHRSRETVAGTGIGLYISKAIVESHGGTIGVRSEDGHGSTFTISLPTYKSVADKLKASNNDNKELISSDGSWIKNHSMFRG